MSEKNELQAWVVSISMGLGHQRATYPLSDIAYGGVQLLGEKETSSEEEMKQWRHLRNAYESLSRMKKIPLIGGLLFKMLEGIEKISPLYPFRDESKPVGTNRIIEKRLKKGMGKTLIDKVHANPLPFFSAYPVAAHIADFYQYDKNYCVVTDTQINRVWVADDPKKSLVKYFAPCGRAKQRLIQYGVPEERIFLTGFPLPKEALGGRDLSVLKKDLGQRLNRLDPQNRFWPLHRQQAEYFLGKQNCVDQKDRPLTICYAVGGAGALKEIGIQIAKSFLDQIKSKEIALYLSAGVRKDVHDYFADELSKIGLTEAEVKIIFSEDSHEYFKDFSESMRTTDILWTKPSELSFYAGLGLPVLMCAPIGCQEDFNREWLLEVQAGIDQMDPNYSHQWLTDYLNEGRLAEAAWDGFLKVHKLGTYKIEEVLATGELSELSMDPLSR